VVEYGWAITQEKGSHAAADNVLVFLSFNLN